MQPNAPEAISLEQINGIIRRQKNLFLLVFSVVLTIAVVVALTLPPIYRAQSTILIEEQQIPQEFVQSTITSYVEERLQVITQQIMSRPRLQEIVDRFNLYPEMRKNHTREEIIARLRKNISLETISADVIDRKTGRPSNATIAFNLSYQGENPDTVVKVTNRLTSLYLEENLRQREEQVSNITTFLKQERDALAQQIAELEEKISRFKQKHGRELPEFNAINLQAINRLTRDLEQNRMQLRSLQERKLYLQGQLTALDPYREPLDSLRSDEGRLLLAPKAKLKALRRQLLSYKARYSPKHPDVRKTEHEIARILALHPELAGGGEELREKEEQLKQLQQENQDLAVRLGDKHPDRVQLTKEIATLKQEISTLKEREDEGESSSDVMDEEPSNPAYINLQVQLQSTELEIASTKADYQELKKRLADYQARLENAPLVERDYKRMLREQEQAQQRYVDISHKLTEAQVSQQMEESQRGERFKIIDPAQKPEKPFKPNRVAIVLIGFVLALGMATGVCALRENLDSSIKTSAELARLTGVPVLSVTPLMKSPGELRHQRNIKIIILTGLITAFGALLALVHFFYYPLDIIWIKVMRRLDL